MRSFTADRGVELKFVGGGGGGGEGEGGGGCETLLDGNDSCFLSALPTNKKWPSSKE